MTRLLLLSTLNIDLKLPQTVKFVNEITFTGTECIFNVLKYYPTHAIIECFGFTC